MRLAEYDVRRFGTAISRMSTAHGGGSARSPAGCDALSWPHLPPSQPSGAASAEAPAASGCSTSLGQKPSLGGGDAAGCQARLMAASAAPAAGSSVLSA